MRRLLSSFAVLTLVTGGPVFVSAAVPDTRPVDAVVDPAPVDPTPHHPQHNRGGMEITDAQRKDAMAFMEKHSPNRFEAIQKLPDGEKKTNFENFVTRGYLNTQRLESDAPLFKVVVARIETEDSIFGLTAAYQTLPADKQDAAKAGLRDQVAKLVDISLQERELRLQRLAKTVDDERKHLDEDKLDREKLIDTRLEGTLKGDLQPFAPRARRGDHRSADADATPSTK